LCPPIEQVGEERVPERRNVKITTTAVRPGVSGMILWSGEWWLASTVCFALVSPLVAVVSRRSLARP